MKLTTCMFNATTLCLIYYIAFMNVLWAYLSLCTWATMFCFFLGVDRKKVQLLTLAVVRRKISKSINLALLFSDPFDVYLFFFHLLAIPYFFTHLIFVVLLGENISHKQVAHQISFCCFEKVKSLKLSSQPMA